MKDAYIRAAQAARLENEDLQQRSLATEKELSLARRQLEEARIEINTLEKAARDLQSTHQHVLHENHTLNQQLADTTLQCNLRQAEVWSFFS